MKTTRIAGVLFPIALLAAQPASAQSTAQLKQENAQLRAQLQALQAQCQAPSTTGTSWQGQHLDARLDTLRVGNPSSRKIEITISMTLRNTGSGPMVLNYETNSLSVTDDNGYNYDLFNEAMKPGDSIKGIPAATRSRVDTSAVIMPGASRTVTFIAARSMRPGQTPGARFDINATFGQYEDLGQGRVRKVRDFPVAFTNVAASGRLTSSASPGSNAVNQAANALLRRLTK